MKRTKIWPGFTLTILSLVLLATSCNDPDPTTDLVGDWTRKSDFEGVSRNAAVSFTIGTRVFVGTGFDGTFRLKDFWEFDADKNTWFRRADFPGAARSSAVAFSAAGKGYVGTGIDADAKRLSDFWEYNPATNSWTQIADFPADAKYRYGAVSLSFDNKGYIGAGNGSSLPTGGTNDLKDWWSYTPATGTWTQEQSIGGSKRTNAFSMIINGKGYVGGGTNVQLSVLDFWEFDPSTASWTQKNDLDDITDANYDWALQRQATVAFSINGLGYLTTGNLNGQALPDCWEYDPTTDQWAQKNNFEGTSRDGAVGFAVGSKGYVTTGRSASARFDDIWEFDPLAEKI